MRIPNLRRWFQSISPHPGVVIAIALLAVVIGQRVTNSRLRAEVSRFQAGQAALLTERASLMQTSDLWKAEAVEWREKNGYVEPPITPPDPNDIDREPIGAPE
jgi:hypothetical protein